MWRPPDSFLPAGLSSPGFCSGASSLFSSAGMLFRIATPTPCSLVCVYCVRRIARLIPCGAAWHCRCTLRRQLMAGRLENIRTKGATAMKSLWALQNITWIELAKRVWREVNEDRMFGRAAELSYYFLLALFPLLIFLTSTIG